MTSKCWCGHHERYHSQDRCSICDTQEKNGPHRYNISQPPNIEENPSTEVTNKEASPAEEGLKFTTPKPARVNPTPVWLQYVGVGAAGYFVVGVGLLSVAEQGFPGGYPGIVGLSVIAGAVGCILLYIVKRKNSSKYDISKQSPPSQTRRPSQATTNTQLDCLECGVENPSVAKHCISCGASLPTNICQKCQTKNLSEAKFCMSCGESI